VIKWSGSANKPEMEQLTRLHALSFAVREKEDMRIEEINPEFESCGRGEPYGFAIDLIVCGTCFEKAT
jgi:hypothetical protein